MKQRCKKSNGENEEMRVKATLERLTWWDFVFDT